MRVVLAALAELVLALKFVRGCMCAHVCDYGKVLVPQVALEQICNKCSM